MTIEHLIFMNKYLAKYKGKAIAVGDSFSEVISEALLIIFK